MIRLQELFSHQGIVKYRQMMKGKVIRIDEVYKTIIAQLDILGTAACENSKVLKKTHFFDHIYMVSDGGLRIDIDQGDIERTVSIYLKRSNDDPFKTEVGLVTKNFYD